MNVYDLIDSAIVEAKAISPVKYEDSNMKSNDVRMQINRNLHAQFKRVDGDTNDERMNKLLTDSWLNFRLVKDVNYHKETAKEWRAMYNLQKAANKTLASALVVSIAVSVCSVAYVCVVNGWFV